MRKPSIDRRDALVFVLLIVITLSGYWQVHDFGFIPFDDPVYVTNNTAVMAGLRPQTISWSLTTPYATNWHPLTWMSLMADRDAGKLFTALTDAELGKGDSGVYHLTNVGLHLANVLLLFVLLLRLTRSRWKSAIVAALFAIHPLHVESVAWVTERKDVLSTLFWLLCMLSYVRYARSGSSRAYTATLVMFCLGLMAKSMLVSLPIVLLLADFWPLRRLVGKESRWRYLAAEKAPLFAMAAISAGLTIWAQRVGGAVATFTAYPLGVRIANAGVAYVRYLFKMVRPVDLAFFYPHPGSSLPVWQVAGALALLAAITALAVVQRARRPYILFGWAWYLVTLLPVIGLLQVGGQAMADRYTYVPLIGIFVAVVWGACDLFGITKDSPRWRPRLAAGIAALAIIALGVMNYAQIGYWRSGVSLFSHALAVTQENELAHFELGMSLDAENRLDEAVVQYKKVVKLVPRSLIAYENLGTDLTSLGRNTEAIRCFKKALKICPTSLNSHNNLGAIYAEQGDYDMAMEHFRAVLKVRPDDPEAQQNLQQAEAMKAVGDH